MVKEKGKEDGFGIKDLKNYHVLTERILEVCEYGISKYDLQIEIEEILVVGSVGSDMGVYG